VVVQGGGYIGVELAGILHALGVETYLVARSGVLTGFDDLVKEELVLEMKRVGLKLRFGVSIERVDKVDSLLNVQLSDGEIISKLPTQKSERMCFLRNFFHCFSLDLHVHNRWC
jgi:glutathione reductase (NADPH)